MKRTLIEIAIICALVGAAIAVGAAMEATARDRSR